jgi:hypothetical protein
VATNKMNKKRIKAIENKNKINSASGNLLLPAFLP